MRKILAIAVLFCATYSLASLVQQTAGGSASGSVVSGGSLTTSAAGFPSSTVTGNLIVVAIYIYNSVSSGQADPGAVNLPVVSGGYSLPAHSSRSASWGFSQGLGAAGSTYVFFFPNAPSLSPGNLFTVQGFNNGLTTSTFSIEFELYEFSGTAVPAVTEGIGQSTNQNGGTVGTTFSSTANTDLIFETCIAQPGSNLAAGSGYTLGINSTVAQVGQLQYQLNAPPGQTAAAFGGSQSHWGAATVAFKMASVVNPVPRRKGSVF